MVLKIPKHQLADSKFGMEAYPVFLWNDQTKTLIGKEFLSTQEKTAFAEHIMLHFIKVAEELNTNFLNFGRYVVSHLSPAQGFFSSGIGQIIKWVLIIVAVGGIGYVFFQQFMAGGGGQIVQNAAQGAQGAANAAGQGGVGSVVPVG